MIKNQYLLTFLNLIILSCYIFLGVPEGNIISLLLVLFLLYSFTREYYSNYKDLSVFASLMSMCFIILGVVGLISILISIV
jgi:hypothetical protein